jgi:hypothetical protein
MVVDSTSASGSGEGFASAAGGADGCSSVDFTSASSSGEGFASAAGGTDGCSSVDFTSASSSGEGFASAAGGTDGCTVIAAVAAKVDCDCAIRATFTIAAGFASSINRDTIKN